MIRFLCALALCATVSGVDARAAPDGAAVIPPDRAVVEQASGCNPKFQRC